jgi:hypothetical protein
VVPTTPNHCHVVVQINKGRGDLGRCVPQGLEFCFLDKARFGDSLLRVKVIKTFLPHFVSNPKDIKDLPKMHNFSYYFCVSLVICKQTFTRKKNSVPRDIVHIVCKPKKTCTIDDLFWTILFHLCVCVCEKERERDYGKIVEKYVISCKFL